MGGINSIALNPVDNNKYLSVGQDRKVTFWDIRKSQAEGTLESSPISGESEELFAVAIQSTGKVFATGGQMGIVRIFNLESGQFISDCRAHSSAIMAIEFSPDGRQIVSTGVDALIAIWNVFI